jgi:alkylation response protein AidB-like acyl-CoA dehydrogenase
VDFDEGPERRALRAAVADLGSKYGQRYFLEQARSGGTTEELWAEAGKLGFLGVNLPEEYGGGGGGLGELALVLEELGTAGCPLLMMVVSPAICGTILARFGTDTQKTTWLPGLADGSTTMAFAITEPDAGSNSHNITTVARREGDIDGSGSGSGGWRLTGRKVWISGMDLADAVLVVARLADGPKGTLRRRCSSFLPTLPGWRCSRFRWRSCRRIGSSRCSSTTSLFLPTRWSGTPMRASPSSSPG